MQVKDQLVSSHGTVGFLTKTGLERKCHGNDTQFFEKPKFKDDAD